MAWRPNPASNSFPKFSLLLFLNPQGMKTNRFTLLLALCAVLFGCGGCIICGCVLIKPYLNFRNSTGQTIAILQKGPIPAFEIAPHKSAKVPFGERTNLTVTVRDRGTYEFER